VDDISPRLDETDLRMMELLVADARRSNVDLARELGLTEGAVRKRIARLLRERFLRFTAARNLRKLGYNVEVIIGVQVDQRRLPGVLQALRALAPVRSIMVTAGHFDLLVEACFRGRDELEEFLTLVLPNVPGISRSETSYVLSVPKRTSDWIDEVEKPGRNGGTAAQGSGAPYEAGAQQAWWRG
jgi:Lrp/AsnC family transcriptional regulator for asnA, asnC and gidA